MLIQNTSGVAIPGRFTSDSAPVVVAAPKADTPRVDVPTAPAPVQDSKPPAEAKPTEAQLKSAVDSLNKMMQGANSELQFSIDKESQKTIVKVVDSSSGEVIKQFPSEEAIAISKAIDQIQQGLLLKQKA